MDSNHTGAKSPAKKRGGRSARRRSREFALQGVYQWLMSHTDPEAIDAAALEAEDFERPIRLFTVNCSTASPKSFRLLRRATLLILTVK